MKENELREAQIGMLGAQRARHHKIFRDNMGRGTNPDGSKEYWEAKKKFDKADRKMKEIEKEIARLTTGGKPLSPSEFEKKFPHAGANMPPGVQTQPSQSKVKL